MQLKHRMMHVARSGGCVVFNCKLAHGNRSAVMQRPNYSKSAPLLSVLLLLSAATALNAQLVTNWIAYNDHVPSATTHANANVYNLRGVAGTPPEPTFGPLRDFNSGLATPANIVVVATGAPDFFGTMANPNAGTPAYTFFNGIADVGNVNSGIGLRQSASTTVTLTFTNLDPAKRYIFVGTSVRGGNYADRWHVCRIDGAASFVHSHQNGGTPGVATAANFPTGTLQPNEAALNSGENRVGNLVIFTDIDPGADGSFSIFQRQYTDNPLPNGVPPNLGAYGYGFCAIALIELGLPVAPALVDSTQPTNRVVLENRSTTLSALATGSPAPAYQWYHNGVAIDPSANPTARSSRYVITRMTAGDAGDYYCEISNIAGTIQTRTASVGYIEDTVAPVVVRAVGSPSLTTITVEFDEEMDTNTTLSAFAYTITPSLSVTAVASAPGDRSFIITTDPQTPDTVYTVTVGAGEVYDYALNPIAAPNNTAQFRSFIDSPSCSGVLFEGYDVAVGSANVIGSLTNHPNFLNGNTYTNVFINRMHSRAVQTDNARENYGARMRTLFIPLVSGNWRFFISTDDPGELWFNPAGSGASGRTLVAREVNCCNLYLAPPASQTSQAFPLTAGKAYYLELLYKEGGGGDFGMVAARLDGAGVPPGGNNQTAEAGEAIGSPTEPSPFCAVGYGRVPANAAGTLSVSSQPANVSTEANRRVTLTVGVNAPDAPYVCYQWQRSDDGGATFNDIPGATRSTYTTPYLTVADDNQDRYRIVLGIPGAQVTSAAATLTVTADVTRPRITRVLGFSSTQIAIYFSEPMGSPSTATDAFSYEMDQGVTIGEAVQNPNNPLRIDLTVSVSTPMALGSVYELTASTQFQQLVDASGNPIDPDPTKITFRAQNFSGNVDTLVELPTNTKLALGALTERGMKGRMVQISRGISPPLHPITEQVLAGQVIDPATGQPYANIAPIPNFVETETINYGDNPTIGTGVLTPDRAFPGYTAVADNMVMEILAYLELYKGIYRMGVNSDDDFQVTPARGVSDPNNSLVLGFFSGGRAPADTIFDFLVPEDGLYPFRLIWNEYQGGATCEWWIQSLADNTFIGVNGSDAIKAFVPPSTTVPSITVTRLGGTMIRLSWTDGEGAYQLQSTLYLEDPAWGNVSGVNVNGDQRTKDIDTAGYPYEFYRLRKP
jgi:hypothetical protein